MLISFRCKEKQFELDSKFEKLQTRINALRSFHVGNHAAKQIQVHFTFIFKDTWTVLAA